MKIYESNEKGVCNYQNEYRNMEENMQKPFTGSKQSISLRNIGEPKIQKHHVKRTRSKRWMPPRKCAPQKTPNPTLSSYLERYSTYG